MPSPLLPAKLFFEPDGTPYSPLFDDVYHSREGGPAQAQHVFLAGNGLPERWRTRPRFTILETGFGAGLNFLATWAAWKEDPSRPARLHYISVEKHPFAAEDLARVHAVHPEFLAPSAELCAAWPMLVPGMHRLEFDHGRVVLTLLFADVATALRQLRLAADAFYLDGFAPAKNPGMWSAEVLKQLPKLAAPGATFSTYTAASSVRDALVTAGFTVEKVQGFAAKRDMLRGQCMRPSGAVLRVPDRRALVIGAGLAGSSVCERLAARGWEVNLIERSSAPAQGASGNHAGTYHPLVTVDDSIMARLTRAAFGHALRHWQTLDNVSWAQCGVLQMPRSEEEALGQRSALSALAYPEDYARYVTREEAGSRAGIGVADGGIWFQRGGWVQPESLVHSLLAKAGVQSQLGTEVQELGHDGTQWTALDAGGHVLGRAPVVVLANAGDALRLAPMEEVVLRRVRGQVSYLPATGFTPIRAVLLRGGMAIPSVGGLAVVGASYDIDDEEVAPRIDSHAGNLERLGRILPGVPTRYDPREIAGRVGFRAVTRDRLPMVGPMTDHGGPPGLFGAFAYASRGILWCSLMAEVLASSLEGDPMPIENRLLEALDPLRFARRSRRAGGLPGWRP